MNRREAVQHISLLLGGSILGAEAFLSGCTTAKDKVTFSEADVAFLDEVGEVILPATNTPGAKAARVGEYMKIMVNDCYEKGDQVNFHGGINTIRELSQQRFGKTFVELKTEQRLELLTQIDNDHKELMKNWKASQPKPYFRLMKELTLLGYFTSKIGCTQARRFVQNPGRYEGCIPYRKGDKAWA